MNRLRGPILRFDWLETALAVIVEAQHGRVEMARVRGMSREIVALCREQRERVLAAEMFLDENRDILSAEQRNDVLRLIAETLLYIQYRGARIRVTDDPFQVLRG